jgi:hypothetical protein
VPDPFSVQSKSKKQNKKKGFRGSIHCMAHVPMFEPIPSPHGNISPLNKSLTDQEELTVIQGSFYRFGPFGNVTQYCPVFSSVCVFVYQLYMDPTNERERRTRLANESKG